MKKTLLPLILAFAAICVAQTPAQSQNASGGIQSNDFGQINNLLLQLDQTSRAAMANLAKLRIEKWKADSSVKQQYQANVDSLQRNLSSALPEIENKVRNAPQDLTANLKLYRNLNALYDVFASVAESAGAFGPKDQYEPLAEQTAQFDQLRRSIADRLEQLATAKEIELSRLRNQVQKVQQQQATQAPKKIVVDDNQPAPKSKKKKTSTPPPS
jgi:hypothetical protein